MMNDWFHPAFLYIFGAILIPFLKGKVRQAYLVLIPLLAVYAVFQMSQGTFWTFDVMGRELILGKVDKLAIVFAYVFTIMSLIGMIYSLHVENYSEHIAAFLYVGSSLGVVFAGDYFTVFVFWEIMAFASVYLVFANRTKRSVDAGFRYIIVHIAGGVLLFGGIILHYVSSGSILFGPIEQDGSLAFYLILIGFILNAAAPPLNAWITDAYPEATVTGAVFMCAYTTKTAVYVLARAFPGTDILVWVGITMTIFGVAYAFLENDFRRLLAYHIVSQVGYMVTGIGIGTEMAVNGAVSHAFTHILYKALLFMGVGSVLYMTGIRKLTELGGLYKTMPYTLTLYMIGAFAISGFPLTSGFVSKSMIVSAASLDHRAIETLLLMMAASGTFLSVGLKLPYYMFFAKDSNIRVKEPPKNMLIGMGIAAFFCIAIGVFPGPLYDLLPYPVDYHPYTADHVTGALSILMFTLLGFVMFLKAYVYPEHAITLDTDWFYRKGTKVFMRFARGVIARYEDWVSELSNTALLKSMFGTAKVSFNVDKTVVDGAINGVAFLTGLAGRVLRRVQTGDVQSYAFVMLAGVVFLMGVYFFY